MSARGIRIVIDSNRMQSDELRAFLSMSPNNKAVLTDYAAMEAFQGNTLVSIQASWSVLRDFPKQILALKGTRAAAKVDPCSAGIADRLVEKSETKAISDFSRVLDNAAKGDIIAQRQLLQRGKWANDHMAGMLAKAGDMHLSIAEFCAVFTDVELQRLRRKEPWKAETAAKFFDLVAHLTEISFAAHPDKLRWPKGRHLLNHFLYRHTLAYCVYMTRLVIKGAVTRKASLARNDAVDVIFATLATYFNGFMSADSQAATVHHITSFLLSEAGARVPEDYMERYAVEIENHMEAEGMEDRAGLVSPFSL
ncbi:MAG TPA: hypothetical protein VF463_03460 [Sphingobium sp.]|jgi:hypothetical protein